MADLLAQSEDRFHNFQIILNPNNQVRFIEAEGYDIFIQTFNYPADAAGIKKIRGNIRSGKAKE